MIRALLDTDVVLDHLIAREPFAPAAAAIWQASEQLEFEAFVSAITPVKVYYIARKLKGEEVARNIVQRLLVVCQIAATDSQVLKEALTLRLKDYEDAVQPASARQVHLELIVTRNQADYQGADIPVLTPENFVERLSSKGQEQGN